MKKPTPASVTDARCSCGYLERSARNPRLPFKFDEELSEYSLDLPLGEDRTLSIHIYHCPMCGGVASQSERPKLVVKITDSEVTRLDTLISNLATIDDVQHHLGAPDQDRALPAQQSLGILEVAPIRSITYTRLSETADLHFNVYADGRIDKVIVPKYLGVLPVSD